MVKAKVKDKGALLKAEVLGFVSLAAALLTVVSLYSFSRGDETNLAGAAGYYISSVLHIAVGYSSWVFPLIFLFLSAEFFFIRRGLGSYYIMPMSLVLFLLASTGIFSMSFAVPSASPSGAPLPPGGVVGGLVGDTLFAWLGVAGTHIVLWTVLAICLVLATGISFVRAGGGVMSVFAQVLRWVAALGALLARAFASGPDLSSDPSIDDAFKRTGKKSIDNKAPARKRAFGEPAIITPRVEKGAKKARADTQEKFEFLSPKGSFQLPPLSLLDPVGDKDSGVDRDTLIMNSKILEKKLRDFDVEGNVVEVRAGPVVTMYEFEPAPGVKVGKIMSLTDDLALAMRAMSIRILAPVPGKAVVGIEIPNAVRERIVLKEILDSKGFQKNPSKLTLALGKDIAGATFVADLMKMPHLLVAGATGAGKSVAVNAMILSILYKATPEDVRFVMIDPKMLELSAYEGIPHLLTPVITEPKRAIRVLKSVVAEMGKRYMLMAEKGAKNIERYNAIIKKEEEEVEKEIKEEKQGGKKTVPGEDEGAGDGGGPDLHTRLPYIVVVIDELADLMMASGKDVEEFLVRLSQMARAAGIHLLVATQRPSVDVITGLIKTNLPARISFQVPSRIDSRTILDTSGAETLLGDGDMLMLPPGSTRLVRIHGAYVSDVEIKKVTDFLKKQGKPSYHKEISGAKETPKTSREEELGPEFMARYREAVEMAEKLEIVSTSYIQRRLRIGYNTAARIIEMMEAEGIVGPSKGSRPREVLRRSAE